MSTTERKRVLFYVQHLLGVGHVRRASLIASAIADNGMTCDVVLGGPEVQGFDWHGARLYYLPSVRAADPSFSRYLTADGSEPDDVLWTARRDALTALIRQIRPDALLIEQFPFGRRPFRHEIQSMIDVALAMRPDTKTLCSVRDILVTGQKSTRNRYAVETLRTRFDKVLVHGDANFIPFGETFPLADEIEDLLFYTGYVAPPAPLAIPNDMSEGEVIVSAGGGAVGHNLLMAALAAREAGLLADRQWRFLIGPNADPTTTDAIRERASIDVVVEPNRSDYPALLMGAGLSISQAGYNTVMDLMRAGCPALVVPFAAEGETEQQRRAEKLAETRQLVVVNERELSAESIATAAIQARELSKTRSQPLSLDGADTSAVLIKQLLSEIPFSGA